MAFRAFAELESHRTGAGAGTDEESFRTECKDCLPFGQGRWRRGEANSADTVGTFVSEQGLLPVTGMIEKT